jgi:hypothetical protein
VKAMIIPRFIGAANLLLQAQYDRGRVGNL